MKSLLAALGAFTLVLLLSQLAARGQTLAEVLSAAQRRQQVQIDYVNANNAVFSLSGSAPSLLTFQGITATYPQNGDVDNLGIEAQIALLRQVWGESAMIAALGEPINLSNYSRALRLLAAKFKQNNPILWPTDLSVILQTTGTDSAPTEPSSPIVFGSSVPSTQTGYAGSGDSSYSSFYVAANATPDDSGSYSWYLNVQYAAGAQTCESSTTGTFQVYTSSGYMVNSIQGLVSSATEAALQTGTQNSIYCPGRYLWQTFSLPSGTNTIQEQITSPVQIGSTALSGSWASAITAGFPSTFTPNFLVNDPNAQTDPTLLTDLTWPSNAGSGGGSAYTGNSTIIGGAMSYFCYFLPNFGPEFSSTAASIPEALPQLKILPDFSQNKLKVRLANDPMNDCDLYWVLESDSTQSLAAHHILKAEGCGNYDAVYSGAAADREPEYSWTGDASASQARWTDFDNYLTEWWQPVLKQLKTATYFVNVVEHQVQGSPAQSSYELDFYRADQVGSKVSGTYSLVPGASPIESWSVQNASKLDTQGGQMEITCTNSTGLVSVWDVTGSDSLTSADYGDPNVDTQTYTISQTSDGVPLFSATETEVDDPNQQYGDSPEYTRSEVSSVDGQPLLTSTTTYWDFDSDIGQIFHPDKTTLGKESIQYSYQWNNDGTAILYLDGISESGGVNSWSEVFDQNEMITQYSSATPSASGSTAVTYNYSGSQVTELHSFNNSPIYELTTVFSNGLTSSTTTATGITTSAVPAQETYYSGSDSTYPWGLSSVRSFDGTMITYNYAWSGTNFVVTTKTGRESTPGVSGTIAAGTQMVATFNSCGMMLSSTVSDIQSNLVLDYARADQSNTPFPSAYTRPFGGREYYGYDGEGELTSSTDQFGFATSVSLDSEHRVVSGAQGSMSYSVSYNPGFLGYTETQNGGGQTTRTYGYNTDPYGESQSWTTSYPSNTTISRDEDGTGITIHYDNATTGQSYSDYVEKDDLEEWISGNVSQPYQISYSFPGSGWKRAFSNVNNSGDTETTTFDALGRVAEQDTPDPNGGASPFRMKYGYASGQLTSGTDPGGGVTNYSYQPDGSIQEVSRGGRFLNIGRSSQGSGQIVWSCSNAAGETVWQMTTSGTNGNETFVPYGQSSQTVTFTPSISSGGLNIGIASSLLNGSKTWQEGAGWQYNLSGPKSNVSGGVSLDSFGGIASETVNPGGVGTNAETLSFTPLGVPQTLSGPISGSYNSNPFSSGTMTLSLSDGSTQKTDIWAPDGEWLGESGYGTQNQSWSPVNWSSANPTRTLDTSSGSATYSYSPSGTLLTRQFPDTSSESFSYSSATGALSTWTPPGASAALNLTPNIFGQPTTLGTFAGIGYDTAGRVNTLADAAGTLNIGYTNGQVTSGTYSSGPLNGDIFGRSYNALGQLQSVSLPESKSVAYTYTSGTLTGVTTVGGESVGFNSFNPVNGRPASYSIHNPASSITINVLAGFDSYGRNTSHSTTVGGLTIAYSGSYNGINQSGGVTAPEGNWVYNYGSNGFLSSATLNSAPAFSYSFDQDGRPTSAASNEYRPASCSNSGVVQIIGSVASSATVAINGTSAPVTTGTFGKTYSLTTGTTGIWQTYSIKAALSGTGAGNTATIQRNVFVPPTTEGLGYDGAGNLHTTSRWSFGWNELGQLTTISETAPYSVASATQINCVYDCLGRRVQKTVSVGGVVTKTTTTLWDNWRPVMETDYNSGGTVIAQRWYTWGPDVSGGIDGAAGIGGLLEIYQVQGNLTTLSVPVYDGFGNVVALVDGNSGAQVASYTYGPFGELMLEAGPRAEQCPFRYQTKLYDSETGYYYFGKRYYNPKTQSWLSVDPIREAGGVNLYAYCNDQPVGNFDPIGEAWINVDEYDANLLKIFLPLNYGGSLGTQGAYMYFRPWYGTVAEDIAYARASAGVTAQVAGQAILYGGAGLRTGGGAMEMLGGVGYTGETGGMGGVLGGVTMVANGFDNVQAGLRTLGSGRYQPAWLENQFTSNLGSGWGMAGYMISQVGIGGIPTASRLLGPKLAPELNLSNYQLAPGTYMGSPRFQFVPGGGVTTPLDWSIVSKTGETRIAHVMAQHGAMDLQKPIQGVFYGDPVATINDAWSIAQQMGIKPVTVNGADIYLIPRANSGFAGGVTGQLQSLDHVTIITRQGTPLFITGFPGNGLPLPRP